jgi:hypothetical protein
MTKYAYINDAEPKAKVLPTKPWRDTQTGITHHLYSYDDTRLAALGWYPVRREPLAEGATGWGEMYADDQTNEFVIPSLPANPEAAHERYLDGLQCSRLQARLELLAQSLWDAVMAWAVSAGGETQAFFEDAQNWQFRDASFQAGVTALGLTEEQAIALIEYAKTR